MKRSCGLVFKNVIKVFYHWWQDPMPSLLVFKNGIHYLTILTGKKKCYRTTKATNDTRLRWFQMRLLHRILPTGRYLFLRKIIDSPLCSFCKQKEETIFQLFWRCTVIQSFWSNLQTLIKETCINYTHFELSEVLVLFGVTDNIITDKVIDLFNLLAKFYFYRCKWGKKCI